MSALIERRDGLESVVVFAADEIAAAVDGADGGGGADVTVAVNGDGFARVRHANGSVHPHPGRDSLRADASIRADTSDALSECGFPISRAPASVSKYVCTVLH